MVDLHGKDKGNISLPKKLQSYDDEDKKNLPTIINTQRTFYNIKIADIENRINRNDDLLDEIETTNERSAAVDAETAKEIANLNKSLSVQNNSTKSLEENIGIVENDRTENRKLHEKKIELFVQKLKNEMYDCLLDLATQFREVNKYINLPNQRLMRENIMNAVIDHKKKMNVRTALMKENIVIAKVQNEVLKRLRKKFYNTKEYFSFINVPDPVVEQKYLMLIEKARQEENDINFQLSLLKTLLHKERTKISVAKYILKRLECKIKALLETFYDLKYNAICLLKYSKNKFETIPQQLESVSNIKEISEDLDLEITVDFIEKELSKETLDEMKHIEDLEEQMKISIKSSEESQELLIEDTFKRTVDF
ncbi:hypothetical protein WN51_00546 [Melipona quadrifasciata]|uniref:Uncharacterized protein n=1 Tax=Melipona quadrifasciata TaxID=166423 RepID=A0A0N0BGI3_9HYME|nr:hypothetical protein WN51_00546 [Melipona quadrifasciata]